MNLNKLAQKVTLLEGQKKSVSIAQVKEVMRLVCRELSKLSVPELADVFKKYKK